MPTVVTGPCEPPNWKVKFAVDEARSHRTRESQSVASSISTAAAAYMGSTIDLGRLMRVDPESSRIRYTIPSGPRVDEPVSVCRPTDVSCIARSIMSASSKGVGGATTGRRLKEPVYLEESTPPKTISPKDPSVVVSQGQ